MSLKQELSATKTVTRQSRIRAHSQEIYRSLLVAIHAKLMNREPAADKNMIREIHNRAAATSIDAASIFDEQWNANRGRFVDKTTD